MPAAITYQVTSAIVTPPNSRVALPGSTLTATSDNDALTQALATAVTAGHVIISVRIIGTNHVCVEVRS